VASWVQDPPSVCNLPIKKSNLNDEIMTSALGTCLDYNNISPTVGVIDKFCLCVHFTSF
jgi:hypothetical protein